jgi:NTE family protein
VLALRLVPLLRLAGCVALLATAGCATRPVNPPIERADHDAGYRYQTRARYASDRDNLVLLAFSGGGTRAAAFSYGVLESLRHIELAAPGGRSVRAIDEVEVITGVSGGSFTALAYGLYGDGLFEQYERRFLKRNVEGELLARLADPRHWGSLSQPDWGRSELAADYYDEILFDGATYADLQRRDGPLVVASATDFSTGGRFYFAQGLFDVLCSDLSAVRLSRAAAASSAVPVVLSPVTLDNYGGSCGYRPPSWVRLIANPDRPLRPAARTMRQLEEIRSYENGKERPYVHLVDGGIADNIGMREIIAVMDQV